MRFMISKKLQFAARLSCIYIVALSNHIIRFDLSTNGISPPTLSLSCAPFCFIEMLSNHFNLLLCNAHTITGKNNCELNLLSSNLKSSKQNAANNENPSTREKKTTKQRVTTLYIEHCS